MLAEQLVDQVALLRAMGHPVRLALLEALAPGEECVCHLTALLGYPQPYISKHLAELAEAGLVGRRRDGQRIYYWLTDPRLAPVLAALRGSTPPARANLAACPCPSCVAARLEGEV